MPRGRKKGTKTKEEEAPKRDPKEILSGLIEKAQKLTDRDIWNHTLGGKRVHNKKQRATEDEEDEELLKETELETDYIHVEKQPSLIKFGQMRDYQLVGLTWMVNLRASGLHGILADEMGLGKTLQTISLLAYLREFQEINGKHLIIVPKSVIINWCREFAKWCPCFKVLPFEAPDKEARKQLIKEKLTWTEDMHKELKWDVLICSYDIAMIEKSCLKKIKWNYIIVDEAHRLKNDSSKFARVAREFDVENRLLLTGTPLQNNLRELWALLNFLLPDIFDSSQDFEDLFDFESTEEKQNQIFASLAFLLKPFMLRRLKSDADKTLPPKTETILFVGMSEVQQDVYKKILMREVQTLTAGAGGSNTGLLNLVMQLRKCTNHPYLFDGVEDLSLDPFGSHVIENAGKLVLLDKLLNKLQEQGSRVLVFSQMTRVLDILEDFCHMKKYKYCRIDGSTTGEERQQQMDVFNEKDSPYFIFLLTTRAGGLGINLQTADVVVIYDSDWNPQMDLQAMDRAHRIGQTKPVKVYRLVTQGTVEERILERAELKLRMDAMIVQKNRQSGQKNSKEKKQELLDMVQYGASDVFKAQGATITDEDIDLILSQGQKKTEELKSKWDKKTQKKFSELGTNFNYQTFEGEDYSNVRNDNNNNNNNNSSTSASEPSLLEMIHDKLGRSARLATRFGNLGRSTTGGTRKSYNIDEYYRERIYGNNMKNANVNNTNNLKAPKPLPGMKFWQFYNEKELYFLHSKEWEFFTKNKNNPDFDPSEMAPLTDEESKQKEKCLSEGFADVSYFDLGAFVRACTQYGRESLDEICDTLPHLDRAYVLRYHKVFFERAHDVDELDPYLQRIQQGEEKIRLREERAREKERRDKEKEEKRQAWLLVREKAEQRRKEKRKLQRQREMEQATLFRGVLQERILKWKESMLDDGAASNASNQSSNNSETPSERGAAGSKMNGNNSGSGGNGVFKVLQLPDAGGNRNGYTRMFDRILFINCYLLGYDNWDLLKERVVKHPLFVFDHFIRAHTAQMMKDRVDAIIRACIQSKKSYKHSKKNKKNGKDDKGQSEVQSEAQSEVTSGQNSKENSKENSVSSSKNGKDDGKDGKNKKKKGKKRKRGRPRSKSKSMNSGSNANSVETSKSSSSSASRDDSENESQNESDKDEEEEVQEPPKKRRRKNGKNGRRGRKGK